jgi:hypothetical protein
MCFADLRIEQRPASASFRSGVADATCRKVSTSPRDRGTNFNYSNPEIWLKPLSGFAKAEQTGDARNSLCKIAKDAQADLGVATLARSRW